MSDDIREAAKRVINGEGTWTGDAIDVAEAYLAEHPTDDDEPRDAEFMRSIGFTVVGDLAYIEVRNGADLNVLGDGKCDIEIDHGDGSVCMNLPTQKTRGSMRRLCAALGCVSGQR